MSGDERPGILDLAVDESGLPTNPRAEAAFAAFTVHPTPEAGRALYEALLASMPIVPEAGDADDRAGEAERRVGRGGERIRVRMVMAPDGGTCFPLFTSPSRLLACFPDGAPATAMTLPAIAKMVLAGEREVPVVVNPSLGGGLVVPRRALEALARREIPEIV